MRSREILFLITLFFMTGAQAASDLVFDNEIKAVASESVRTESLEVVAPDSLVSETAEENLKIRDEATPAAQKAETEIPVQLDSRASGKADMNSLRDLLLGFGVLFGFLLLGYLFLRRLKNRQPKASQFQMKVLSQHHLGPKKSLAVVRVAGESILIGVTDHHISMIKSLALLDEDLPEEVPSHDFGSLFRPQSREQLPPHEGRASRTAALPHGEVDSEDEDFAISKIRDVVTRQVRQLKSLE